MKRLQFLAVPFLLCAATMSSKDKSAKVAFHDMAVNMRDAFNCGVVVEKYLHGPLKGQTDAYQKARQQYNCSHVEDILNTLHDQDSNPSPDQPTQ